MWFCTLLFIVIRKTYDQRTQHGASQKCPNGSFCCNYLLTTLGRITFKRKWFLHLNYNHSVFNLQLIVSSSSPSYIADYWWLYHCLAYILPCSGRGRICTHTQIPTFVFVLLLFIALPVLKAGYTEKLISYSEPCFWRFCLY